MCACVCVCVCVTLQAELSEVESSLTTKRNQLDTVASLLVSHQKQADYEATKKAISDEEVCVGVSVCAQATCCYSAVLCVRM